MARLLENFDVLESRVMIERWQDDDDSLNEYLSKLGYFDAFISILWRYMTSISCLVGQMYKISLEEWKKRWDKIKSECEETHNPQSHP